MTIVAASQLERDAVVRRPRSPARSAHTPGGAMQVLQDPHEPAGRWRPPPPLPIASAVVASSLIASAIAALPPDAPPGTTS